VLGTLGCEKQMRAAAQQRGMLEPIDGNPRGERSTKAQSLQEQRRNVIRKMLTKG
jgi:hypothetical protein